MLEKFETIIFDESCISWTADKEYNKMFIRHSEVYHNDRLRAIGWVCLNDVYASLGLPLVIEAQVIGWKITDGINENNCVKFELEETGINSRIIIKFKNMVKLL